MGKVSDDARESFRDILYTAVNPLTEMVKTQNLQQLMAWEEAGRLPPGTVQRMMSTSKPTEGERGEGQGEGE